MALPFISYITFNRMGLTARNINALLRTTDDFELHLLDSNSKDGTWEYLQSLTDRRIKSRDRLPVNYGPIYAVNYNLAKRKPDQYFIALDSDVCIHTPDWISRFMNVFREFPEVGVLGVPKPYSDSPWMPPVIPRSTGRANYLQLKNGYLNTPLDFVPGHCQCLRPELIKIIGYWSEESYFGDAELSVRVNNYTPYKAGFTTDIVISMEQSIPCDKCEAKGFCNLDRVRNTCFSIHAAKHKNVEFVERNHWKYIEFFNELNAGKRTVYCASIHDPVSIANHTYNASWAIDNFNFYVNNGN